MGRNLPVLTLGLCQTWPGPERRRDAGDEAPLTHRDCLGWNRSILVEAGECPPSGGGVLLKTAAFTGALLFQACLVALAIMGPFSQDEPLPEPRVVKSFIIAPQLLKAPSPPPPPAGDQPMASPPSVEAPGRASRRTLPSPLVTATSVALPAELPASAPDFVSGGVGGGVPGGVLGGRVGGLNEPPSPAGPKTPIRAGSSVAPPRKIRHVDPVYPAIARYSRQAGVVILEATIDVSGNVTDVSVLESIALLDEPAIDAVRQWKYEPTLMDGIPVPVIMTVTVQFALTD